MRCTRSSACLFSTMGFTRHELKVYTHEATGVTQLWLKTGSSLWSFIALWYIVWLVSSHL